MDEWKSEKDIITSVNKGFIIFSKAFEAVIKSEILKLENMKKTLDHINEQKENK
jgi:hypothetical protein